ncbi:MAG: metallophosphoesterase [Methylococcaceae bacterium]|nr:metallophosphoesterase [Methylococcaceae bacterium]
MMDEKKILFAGDPHGDFNPLIDAVKKYLPEAIILLGDYDLKKPLEQYIHSILDKTQVWWIPGNHDFDLPLHHENLFSSKLSGNGLHLKTKEIAGLRIAGLGGIFLGRVWYPTTSPKWKSKKDYVRSQGSNSTFSGLSLKIQSAIWPDEVAKLKILNAYILVTHEAPRSHRHGFIVIDQLAEAMGVKKVFHGHLHEQYTARIRKDIQVFGVGKAMVSDLLGNEL